MRKYNCRAFVRFVLALCIFSSLAGPSAAQTFKAVHDGVEYARVTRQLSDQQSVKIDLLRLDLTKVRIDVSHAMDAAIGTETTSSIAKRHGAVAAVNAGFFRLDQSVFAGDSAGVLMVDGRLLSESSNDRIAMFVSNGRAATEVNFAHINIGEVVRVKRKYRFTAGVNRERKADDLVRYTSDFHPTTLTSDGGVEILVRKGKIISIVDGRGNNEIPRDGYIISASGKSKDEMLKTVKIGTKVKLWTAVTHSVNFGFPSSDSRRTSSAFSKAEDITNGVPQLIRDGRIAITWEQEKASKSFAETRHPRTAVAKLKDEKFLMMTVDGRQPGVSAGMNLNELAEFLLELGAVDAMNLDGGGSTTMVLDGRVVNTPSDKAGERKVSDALLVTLRAKRN